MRDQHQRCGGIGIQAEKKINDLCPGAGIQIAGGLVGKKNGGFAGKRASQGYTLLFATGKLAWCVMQAMRKADFLQPFLRYGFATATIHAESQHHVFQRRKGRHQQEGLEDKTDLLPAQFSAAVFIQIFQLLPAQTDAAGGGCVQSGEQAEQGGFARARSTYDGHAFTAFDGKLHVVENGQGAIATGHGFADIRGRNQGFGGH